MTGTVRPSVCLSEATIGGSQEGWIVPGSIIKAPCRYAKRLIITFTWPAENTPSRKHREECTAHTCVAYACTALLLPVLLPRRHRLLFSLVDVCTSTVNRRRGLRNKVARDHYPLCRGPATTMSGINASARRRLLWKPRSFSSITYSRVLLRSSSFHVVAPPMR